MATSKVLFSGNNRYIINVTGGYTADGNADLNAALIDRSTLVGPDGVNPPGKIRIDTLTWSVGVGYDYLLLKWDDSTDENIEYLQGQGFMDYRPFGGKVPTTNNATTGDVVGVTSGATAATDTYSVLIECTLKQ